jgi:signal peptidase II
MDWVAREKMTREWRWGVPLIFGIVALDQLTKAWVLATGDFKALECLSNYACGRIELSSIFNLSMTWNRGVSFGAFQADGLYRWGLFVIISIIAVGFTSWLLRAERRMTALALSMVVGGAVGNLIDRARFGAVVDFIDFSGPWFGWTIGPWPWNWPPGWIGTSLDVGFPWIFNVADASITCGAVTLALDQLLAPRKRPG